MLAGLQIFKKDGSLSLDINSIVFKELGSFCVRSFENGSYKDASIGDKDIFLIIKNVNMTEDGVCHAFVYPTHLSYKENTFSWDFANTHFNIQAKVPRPSFAKYEVTYTYGWLS